jgi:hypothetical protein
MRKFVFVLLLLVICPLLGAQQTAAPNPPAPSNPSDQPAASPAKPPEPHTLLDGTPIKLRLSQTISSADAKVGQEIPFEVIEEVKVDDVIVIPKGATAIGTVTDANAKKSMGRAGKLNISISYVRLADQEKAALRAEKDSKGGGHVGAMTGAMVATSIVFFPAAPLFLFMHGKDITIPQGTEITAFVQGDMHLDMAKFGVAPVKPAGAAQEATANVAVDSTPPGADIEVDGGFVGNTPSTVTVTQGIHEITVKKKGFADWSRKLNVTGGSIHLAADLQAGQTATPVAPPTPAQTQAPTPASGH